MLNQIYNIIGQTFDNLSPDIVFAACVMIIILVADRFFAVLEYVLHLLGGKK